MKQQQTDAILDYVRHAPGNERLMELSFGCEVEVDTNIEPLRLKIIEKYRGKDDGRWLTTEHMVVDSSGVFGRIIGHPVQWANVLVAMYQKSKGPHRMTDDNYIEMTDQEKKDTVYLLERINLSTPPAEELLTNDEAREFLLELFNLNDHGSN